MAKIRIFIILVILCSRPVSAVELDQLQINSFIYEPLNASIAILGVDKVDLADIRFTVASKSDYRKFLGTKRPAYLNKVKVDIIAVENGRHELHITSPQRVREPILTFLLKVIEKQGSVFKKYNLLMDPRIEPAEPLTAAAGSLALTVEPSVSTNTEIKTAPDPIIDRKDDRENIIARDQSISIIAQNSTLHDKFSVYQIMRGFYMENPQAFEKGNIDKLVSGSNLLVPPESLIGEVPRQQAINFVYSVSKDNVTISVSTANANQAGVSTNQLAPPAEIIGVLNARETSSQSSVIAEPVKPTLKTLSEAIQRDIKNGRGIANEFASVSRILKSQNKAMKIQNDELISMADNMENQKQQILRLRMRMNELLASQQSGGVANIDSAPLTNSVIADQKSVIADDQRLREMVNQDLMQINSEINQLKSELAILIENNPERINQPLPDEEQPVQSKVINENATPQLVSTNAQDPSGFPRLWITLMGIVAIGIALFFALREWTWRRRIKEQHPIAAARPKKQAQPQLKKKPSTYSSSRGNAGTIELKDLTGSGKNPVKSSGVDDKSTFKLRSHTVDEVKLECDTLIAYELYSEALQLVYTARDNFGDNAWFDVKELEVLASSGQCDKFFILFDQSRERLEQVLPESWERIENLRKQMHEDFKITAVQ